MKRVTQGAPFASGAAAEFRYRLYFVLFWIVVGGFTFGLTMDMSLSLRFLGASVAMLCAVLAGVLLGGLR